LITERPIRFVFCRTVVECFKRYLRRIRFEVQFERKLLIRRYLLYAFCIG